MKSPAGEMEVPFFKVADQNRALRSELLPVLEEVLESGCYVLGPQVAALENEMAAASGVRFGIGVNSGTDALKLALQGLGIGRGDEVITPAFGFIAAAEAIHELGAQVIFGEIDPVTLNLDPAAAAGKVTPRTRALLPIHLFGRPAPLPELLALGEAHGVPVVEDCAQAAGAEHGGRPVGGWGRVGCFSFYPTKNLGGIGDGGMVTTDDEALAGSLRMLRNHGADRRYYHDRHGWNSRLDELHAAVIRVKHRHLEQWNRRRAAIAARYSQGLEDLPVQTPAVDRESGHVFHVYAIRTDRRDALQAFLESRGISTLIYYPVPLHLQPVYRDQGYREGDFPEAERVARSILPLPIYPELTDIEVDYVIDQIRRFFEKGLASG